MIAMQCLQVKRVRCEASGVLVAKDKAIKRFIVRNIVDASAIRDIQDSSILEGEHTSSSPSAQLMRPDCLGTRAALYQHVIILHAFWQLLWSAKAGLVIRGPHCTLGVSIVHLMQRSLYSGL